ncbi:YIP1 family protein [Staphylococcus caeli]|uniref:Yip1 domain n=1 Tax=Staphylococcus caeli TaxID=2201815 RepID=A0A1D4MS00_9STAP|nr:YIP1 family protein [Staphylococcus caeli]SCS82719.1 Yip1 domain [Staphylococcus caeli]SCT01245.1 Yip1 domain [Staphylococcus caeli]
MESSNLPLASHFASLREKPTWGLKLLNAIIIVVLSSIIVGLSTDYKKVYEDAGLSGQQLEQSLEFAKILGIIGGAVGAIITIGITFVVILVISKIMKSDASTKSIFSATLSYTIITSVIALIVFLIQWIAGLSVTDYSITSLNIFDKGNKILGAFNLQTFIGAYVFGILLFATCRFSKKSAIIWSIAYLVVFIGFPLLGVAFQ